MTFDGVWGRVIGHYGHRDGDPIGIYGSGGPEFDYRFGALQTGLDFYRNENQDGTIDHAGMYFAFGHGEVDVQHNLLDRHSMAAQTASMRARSAPTGRGFSKTTPISTASCKALGTT